MPATILLDTSPVSCSKETYHRRLIECPFTATNIMMRLRRLLHAEPETAQKIAMIASVFILIPTIVAPIYIATTFHDFSNAASVFDSITVNTYRYNRTEDTLSVIFTVNATYLEAGDLGNLIRVIWADLDAPHGAMYYVSDYKFEYRITSENLGVNVTLDIPAPPTIDGERVALFEFSVDNICQLVMFFMDDGQRVRGWAFRGSGW